MEFTKSHDVEILERPIFLNPPPPTPTHGQTSPAIWAQPTQSAQAAIKAPTHVFFAAVCKSFGDPLSAMKCILLSVLFGCLGKEDDQYCNTRHININMLWPMTYREGGGGLGGTIVLFSSNNLYLQPQASALRRKRWGGAWRRAPRKINVTPWRWRLQCSRASRD